MKLLQAARRKIASIRSEEGPKLLRDLASLFTGQGFSMVVGFLAFAYAARQLDPASYGLVELAISIAAFGALVIECGAGTIGVRELAKRRHEAGKIAAQVVAARAMVAAVVIPAAAVAGMAAVGTGPGLLLVLLFVASLVAAPFKQDWMLQGHDQMTLAALAQPIRALIFALGVFVFLRGGTAAFVVGWVEIAAVAPVTAYYLFAQYRWTAPFTGGWPIREAFYFLRQGVSVGLANMLWAFMLYVPIYLLASIAGTVDAAWFGASNRIVVSLVTFSFIYHFNLYPVVARIMQDKRGEWPGLMGVSVRLVAWGSIGLATILALFAVEIMGVVFGPEYKAAGPVLALLAWILPMRMLSGHGRWSLIASGGQKHLLRAELSGAVALVAMALVLIPRYGAAGAAAGFIGGIAVSFLVTQWATSRTIARMGMARGVAVPAATAAAVLLTAHFLELGVWAKVWLVAAAAAAAGVIFWRKLFDDLVQLAYAKEHLR